MERFLGSDAPFFLEFGEYEDVQKDDVLAGIEAANLEIEANLQNVNLDEDSTTAFDALEAGFQQVLQDLVADKSLEEFRGEYFGCVFRVGIWQT